MDQELDVHHQDKLAVSGAIRIIGEAVPATGLLPLLVRSQFTSSTLVSMPPSLGGLIAAALVGNAFSGFSPLMVSRRTNGAQLGSRTTPDSIIISFA